MVYVSNINAFSTETLLVGPTQPANNKENSIHIKVLKELKSLISSPKYYLQGAASFKSLR